MINILGKRLQIVYAYLHSPSASPARMRLMSLALLALYHVSMTMLCQNCAPWSLKRPAQAWIGAKGTGKVGDQVNSPRIVVVVSAYLFLFATP